MQLLLEHIQLLEETSRSRTYECLSAEQALPGQYINYNGQPFEILRCRKSNHQYQWQFQTPADTKLAKREHGELTGESVVFVPSEPTFIFAEGKGISMALHMIDQLRQTKGDRFCRENIQTVIFHQTGEFNFAPTPSTFILPSLPSEMIAAVPLLEDLGIASRLCSEVFSPGCFDGNLIALMQNHDWQATTKPWLGFVNEATENEITQTLGQASLLRILTD